MEEVKNLIVELQDSLREFEPEIVSPGMNVRDSYMEFILDEVNYKNGKIFIAREQDKTIGFMVVYVDTEADEDVSFLFVSDVAVSQNHRGRGVGKKLLATAEQYAKKVGIEYVRLGVFKTNESVLKLYRDEGYKDFFITLHKKLDKTE